MAIFKLTPEQIEIASRELDLAEDAYYKNLPGIVLAQTGRVDNGNVICDFEFIGHETAKKIVSITNPESIKEENI